MADKVAHRSSSARLRKVTRETVRGRFEVLSLDETLKLLGKQWLSSEVEQLVIPRRTLARRKQHNETLTREETDRALRLARIAAEANRVFGNRRKAFGWLRAPNKVFSGQAPVALLRTELGAVLVEEALGRIDHGMFA